MRPPRGSLRYVPANLGAPGYPLARRLALTLRNALRRLGPPPRGCCGHPGEPGC